MGKVEAHNQYSFWMDKYSEMFFQANKIFMIFYLALQSTLLYHWNSMIKIERWYFCYLYFHELTTIIHNNIADSLNDW